MAKKYKKCRRFFCILPGNHVGGVCEKHAQNNFAKQLARENKKRNKKPWL